MTGLQAAIIVVREFNLAKIPAFCPLIVYYSIASNTEGKSFLLIRLNSSIQQIPISAKINAPASKTYSLSSLV